MSISWISLYPDWYIQETTLLHKHYPHFKIDQNRLQNGQLIIYGNLVVRPPGGAKEYPIRLQYPAATPYEHPRVTPIESLPEWTDNGTIVREVKAKMLDHRHQMPAGNLCLFQHETRSIPGGDILRGIDILKRAEQYFIGLNTGHWPPDTAESELDSHFNYDTDILIAETFYRDVTDGYGKFLFISDIYRLRDAQNGTLCPSIVIAMTEESNIIQNFDARKELSRVYPWITNKIWDSYNFILKDNLKEEDPLGMIRYGYWWSLPQEPLPFHDGSGLLKTLALTTNGDIDEAWRIFNTTLGADLTSDNLYFIGFRYPSRKSGCEWLFLFVFSNVQKNSGCILIQSDSVKRRKFEKSELGVAKVHRISSSILRQRNKAVINENISMKKIGLIGLVLFHK